MTYRTAEMLFLKKQHFLGFYAAFHGASMQQVCDTLGKCVKSVENDWTFSRTQLAVAFKIKIQLSYCIPLKFCPLFIKA